MVIWVYVLVKGSFTGVFDEKTEVKYLVHHSITCQNLEFKSLTPNVSFSNGFWNTLSMRYLGDNQEYVCIR